MIIKIHSLRFIKEHIVAYTPDGALELNIFVVGIERPHVITFSNSTDRNNIITKLDDLLG